MAQHAQQLGVTPTHLARASLTATCVTAANHLTTRPLYQTQTALIDTKQSAKDIAAAQPTLQISFSNIPAKHRCNCAKAAKRSPIISQNANAVFKMTFLNVTD